MVAEVVLILLTGLIHLLDASESLEESTTLGILFYANFAGAVVAAIGILMGRTWGWTLGALVAGGAFVGYIISRTVGIFGLPPEEWLEPLGVASLIVEGLFVALFVKVALFRERMASPARSS